MDAKLIALAAAGVTDAHRFGGIRMKRLAYEAMAESTAAWYRAHQHRPRFYSTDRRGRQEGTTILSHRDTVPRMPMDSKDLTTPELLERLAQVGSHLSPEEKTEILLDKTLQLAKERGQLQAELAKAQHLLLRWLYPSHGAEETANELGALCDETLLALPKEFPPGGATRYQLAMGAIAAMLEARDKLRQP